MDRVRTILSLPSPPLLRAFLSFSSPLLKQECTGPELLVNRNKFSTFQISLRRLFSKTTDVSNRASFSGKFLFVFITLVSGEQIQTLSSERPEMRISHIILFNITGIVYNFIFLNKMYFFGRILTDIFIP